MGAQAVYRIVRDNDRLIDRFIRNDTQHRPENFFLGDPRCGIYVGEYCRSSVEALFKTRYTFRSAANEFCAQVAIIWEGDDPAESRNITYRERHEQVCKFANALRGQDVHRGDVVTIYMPMTPEAVVAMLAWHVGTTRVVCCGEGLVFS